MTSRRLACALSLLTLLAGCALEGYDDDLPMPWTDESDPGGKADMPGAPEDHQWIYNGILPALESPQLVLSVRGHTVRVTGLLPRDWHRPLPYYAVLEPSGGRTRAHVVYPIATANTAAGSTNASAGDYPNLGGPVYTPNNVGGNGVPWGGFPYLEYDHNRGIALHGPITWTGSEWRLRRGPVSHGCNRMQGEHVVELAHLLGKDMTRPHDVGDGLWVYGPNGDFMIRVTHDYDYLGGKIVDVDYPASAGFTRPTGTNVRVFPTWSASDFPRFACQYRSGRAAGPSHCDYRPAILGNPLRPEDVGQIECPSGFHLEQVGTEGGRFCTNAISMLGPYTRAMVEACRQGGGGGACETNLWARAFALDLRGNRICPAGAALDYRDTAYCVEESDAFGPFPRALVERCGQLGGGNACASTRWSHGFLSHVLESLRNDP